MQNIKIQKYFIIHTFFDEICFYDALLQLMQSVR